MLQRGSKGLSWVSTLGSCILTSQQGLWSLHIHQIFSTQGILTKISIAISIVTELLLSILLTVAKDVEVLYSGRHKHRLYLSDGLIRYRCKGCKAYGANTGYKYRLCGNVTFHRSCIELPDDCVHPRYPRYTLRFHKKPKRGQRCDICGDKILGFVFRLWRIAKNCKYTLSVWCCV